VGDHDPFVVGDWRGTTATRTVYDYDDRPHGVVVLEEVRGPHLGQAFLPGHLQHAAEPPSPAERTEYLVGPTKRAVLPAQVPPGLRVRVEGFKRVIPESLRVLHPERGWQVARSRPMPGPPPHGPEVFFRPPLIKARRVYEVRPDGSERLVWETDQPWRDL